MATRSDLDKHTLCQRLKEVLAEVPTDMASSPAAADPLYRILTKLLVEVPARVDQLLLGQVLVESCELMQEVERLYEIDQEAERRQATEIRIPASE